MPGSRVLLSMSLPCRRGAALSMLSRLLRRLRAEALAGLYMAALAVLGAVAAVATLPEPLGLRAGYAAALLAVAALSAAYSARRRSEARAAERLVEEVEAMDEWLPEGLCGRSLGELLRGAMRRSAG